MAFLPLGDKRLRLILEHLGGPEALLAEKPKALRAIPRVGDALAAAIQSGTALASAEAEWTWMTKHEIQFHWHEEETFPWRLQHCSDGPLWLFTKGQPPPSGPKIAAVVGTRDATPFGMDWAHNAAAKLASSGVQVVSGLALGIDTAAHRGALEQGPTWGVLGHGLDRIYPYRNRTLAIQMLENGGLITEFPRDTLPDRGHFPRRNRIIAGLADATIVVEAKSTGGALITAELAASYNREVFAVPGRPIDPTSAGTLHLLLRQTAQMATRTQHILEAMGWEAATNRQLRIFPDLTADEQALVDLLQQSGKMELDPLSYALELPVYQVLNTLLALELKDVVQTLPGRVYQLKS
jgi:DNA processing protein